MPKETASGYKQALFESALVEFRAVPGPRDPRIGRRIATLASLI